MMRPATLARAFELIIAGAPREVTLSEVLETGYLARTPEPRRGARHDEPPMAGDARLDAVAGAVAEYLARQYRLPTGPAWAFEPGRYLDSPWHTSAFADDGMREYLTFASPAEFRSRNIFTEERPLRRARSGLAP